MYLEQERGVKDRRKFLTAPEVMLSEYPIRVRGYPLDSDIINARLNPSEADTEQEDDIIEFKNKTMQLEKEFQQKK